MAADKLSKYHQKRSFDVTSEPEGELAQEDGRLYVIQEHNASHLHWDLRLQHAGVLLSWAVPKGPPQRYGIRRLAVHVEDHPLDYAMFEGEIPKGQYGAGSVVRWDLGVWEPYGNVDQQLKEGKLEFELHAEKLNGAFVLVRTNDEKDEWLWMKMKPKSPSRRAQRSPTPKPKGGEEPQDPFPNSLSPMLCTRVHSVPEGDDWVHEIKWDGYRVMAWIERDGARFLTRNGNPIDFEGLNRVLASAFPPNSIIDGEAVVFDEKGISRFPLIQHAIKHHATGRVVFVAFDAPFLDGSDLRGKTLEERKKRLSEYLPEGGLPRLRFSQHSSGNGRELIQLACRTGLEGVVSKKASSKYRSIRGSDWVKVRCEKSLEVELGGFTLLADTHDHVGSLLVGIRSTEGHLDYIGRVGTGFSDALRRSLFKELIESVRTSPPFASVAPQKDSKAITWVEPFIRAKVQFLDWSSDGLMRQPKLREIIRSSQKRLPKKSMVKITHPERILDPSSGATKGQIADYYASVAELMLPYLQNRPLSMLRCPDGITDQCFFQKHRMKGLPESVKSVEIDEDDEKAAPYVFVDSVDGLLALVQMGTIEFHPWGSTVDRLELPDVLVFDLDPAPELGWRVVVESAFHVRDGLRSVGFDPLTKVTGGKGIHIIVPVEPTVEWSEAKRFCEHFAKTLATTNPKRYVAKVSKTARTGKILIDYLRNGRGATAVAPYSLRARPNLPVALPVKWEDLPSLEPAAFPLSSSGDAIERYLDAWSDYEDHRRPWPKF